MANKAITSRDVDFAKWYTDVVRAAKLCDYSSVKGCMVIEPNGYAIWEKMREILDKKFKELGHQNVAMPVLIPEKLLKKEGELVEGFAPEVAWVTEGGSKKLEERLAFRPTSETLFCDYYKDHVKSYRDLPKLYNQWCNVIRWEKETRPILRSREFYWQEGHTMHATEQEARDMTIEMLNVYADLIEDLLAIPVVKGKKTNLEKFAGAVDTYTVETLMHDGRAIQAGTSHYLGQNFTKPFGVKFQNKDGKEEFAYHTSWGISVRLIGAMIMAHGDNRGLKVPPKLAPIQVVIVPIQMQKEGVLDKAKEIYNTLNGKFRVKLDDRDQYSPGYKFNDWEMRGVPVRIEMGPRDIENNKCVVVRRDTLEKIDVNLDKLSQKLEVLMEDIQKNMYNMCKENVKIKTTEAHNMEEFEKNINENQGYIKAMWCGDDKCEEHIHDVTGAKSRCIPFEEEKIDGKCVVCGKEAKHMVMWGRQY